MKNFDDKIEQPNEQKIVSFCGGNYANGNRDIAPAVETFGVATCAALAIAGLGYNNYKENIEETAKKQHKKKLLKLFMQNSKLISLKFISYMISLL